MVELLQIVTLQKYEILKTVSAQYYSSTRDIYQQETFTKVQTF